MTSQIDTTLPVYGNPTTQSVRDNFTTAATEISALQDATAGSPFLPLAGASMSGPMYLANDPTDVMMPATKGYVDAHSAGGGGGIPEAPADANTYGRRAGAWQAVVPAGGGTMSGLLVLSGDPSAALGAVTKQYVDAIGGQATGALQKAGGTMTGPLVLAGDATANLNPVSLQQFNAALALKAPLASPTFTGLVTMPRRAIVSGTGPSLSLLDTTSGGLPVFTLWNAGSNFCIGPGNAAGDSTGPAYLNIDGSGNITTRLVFTNNSRITVSAPTNPALSVVNTSAGGCFGIWSDASSRFVFGRADGTGVPQATLGYFDASANLTVNGALTVTNITNHGTTALTGNTTSSGNITAAYLESTGNLDVGGTVGISADLNVSGDAAINGVTQAYGNLQTNASLFVNGAQLYNDGTYLHSPKPFLSEGNIVCDYLLPGHNTNGMQVGNNGVVYYTNWGNVAFMWDGTYVQVHVNGAGVGAIQMVSDIRRKTNIIPSTIDGLAAVRALDLIEFDFPNRSERGGPDRHFSVGFSAQQVRAVLPDAVIDPPETDPALGLDHALNLDDRVILAATVRAVQQLADRLETLEGKR